MRAVVKIKLTKEVLAVLRINISYEISVKVGISFNFKKK